MPPNIDLLTSIRRWLRVTALLLGLAVVKIASVAEGVDSYTTAAPASKLLAAVAVCVAAYTLMFEADLRCFRRPGESDADGNCE